MKNILLPTLLSMFTFFVQAQTNTKLGAEAGNTGNGNTSIGYYAGDKITGSNNLIIGATAGINFTSGEFNSMIGYRSGYYYSNGSGNVFLGGRSGEFNQTGNNNVFIGRQAGRIGNGSQNVFIGFKAGYGEGGSNKLYIENSESDTPLIYGDFNTDLLRVNGKLEILSEPGELKAPMLAMESNDTYLKGLNTSLLLLNKSKVDGNWARLHFSTLNSEDEESAGVSLAANYTNHTAGNESADFIIATKNNGLYTEKIRVKSNGFVGIGTINPERPLEIYSENSVVPIRMTSNRPEGADSYLEFKNNGSAKPNTVLGLGNWGSMNGAFVVKLGDGNTEPAEKFRIDANGNVGIGTIHPGEYKLAVNGEVKVKEINVSLDGWSDFVFEEDYALPTLSAVEEHIQKNKHLPGIPSASEVESNGVNLGEMDAKLLQKIEELTLYMIAQEKLNQAQSDRLEKLEEENKELSLKITELEGD